MRRRTVGGLGRRPGTGPLAGRLAVAAVLALAGSAAMPVWSAPAPAAPPETAAPAVPAPPAAPASAAAPAGETSAPSPAAPPAPSAPSAGTPPPAAESATEAALAALQKIGRALDRLRPVSPAFLSRVTALVGEGLASLDGADAALAQQLKPAAAEKKPPRALPDKDTAARTLRLRTDRCRLALARGELHLAAAAALPEGHAERAANLRDALEAFRTLRVDYHDLALGLMGYVGEARAQRLAGDARAAASALEPVRRVATDLKNPAVALLRRVVMLENLEAALAADPASAAAQVETARRGPEFAGRADWLPRLDYLAARALAAQAAKAPADGPDAARRGDLAGRAADLLRSDGVRGVAPPYDRLALLVQLDALADGRLLAREELLAWADVLAAAGRPDATAFYDRARAGSGGPLAAKDLVSYVALSIKEGRLLAAADACDRLLAALPPADPQRVQALEWRAGALLRLLGETAPAARPAPLVERTLAAFQAVAESPAPDAVRRDALRQYAALKGEREGPAGAVPLLAAHRTLVEGDAWLLYALAAGEAERLAADMEAGGLAEAEASARAAEVLAATDRALAAAEKAADRPILARATLLRARTLAGPPLRRRREALAALQRSPDVLKEDAAVAGSAAWLRVELLLDLGLAEEASKALEEAAGGSARGEPEARLRLAETLALRYAAVAPEGRAEVQRRVLALAESALAQAAGDEARFADLALRAGRALLEVDAHADARRVLDGVLASERVRADAARRREASLLAAEALRRGGQLNPAIALLDRLAAEDLRAADVHLARGRCLLDLSQPGPAAEAFRAARGLAREGRRDWCQATLALAEALAAANRAGDAADILRVAEALYPDFGDPELRGRLRALRRRVEAGPGA